MDRWRRSDPPEAPLRVLQERGRSYRKLDAVVVAAMQACRIREHGWGATVHGRGWTHIGSSCTYDFLVIFEFGQWSKTTDRW